MNHDTLQTDPQILFYDLDYPWPEDEAFKQAESDPFIRVPLKDDIEFMLKTAMPVKEGERTRVLDLCCGTGRLSIPLARSGYDVVAIDVSESQLERMRWRLGQESEEVRSRVEIVCHDVSLLNVEANFDLVVIGFNSLNLIDSFAAQRCVMDAAASALKPGGVLVADMLNPLQTSPHGTPVPVPMASRFDAATGRRYMKFGVASAMNVQQRQVITGWYDITEADHSLKRMNFEMKFRFIFPNEFALMAELAGLEIKQLDADYRGNQYHANLRKLIGVAQKPLADAGIDSGLATEAMV